METSFKDKAIELLSVPPSKDALLTLISWLDLACSQASSTSLPQQILARAMVAVGYQLYKTLGYKTLAQTIEAAEQFALEPTIGNFDQYQNAATNSYPFGAGDGCYAIPETGYHGCDRGSGCRSGSGALYLAEIDKIVTMEIIQNALLPWLLGETDPPFAE